MLELLEKNERSSMSGFTGGPTDALWAATAIAEPVTHPIDGDVQSSVAIVGAGFTGLNAAISLALKGIECCVIDSQHLGFGASGRSGGQVNLGLNVPPSGLIKMFGEAVGRRMIQTIIDTPGEVFNNIGNYGLNCDAVQNGWLQGATTHRQLRWQQNLAADYRNFGFEFESLSGEEFTQRSGARGFNGGLYCPVAGSLHPLSYTRELARYALSLGVRIHTHSPAESLTRKGSQWLVKTPNGSISADSVLICTNGYTEKPLMSLSSCVVPVRSLLIASEPLSADMKRRVLPGQVTFVDKRRLILYARYDRDGRFCVGDHGPMRDEFTKSDFGNLKQRVVRAFPDLETVKWDYHWGGRVAMTKSTLPFLHRVSDGVVAAMGYNGRGVGMGSVMGRLAAEYLAGKPENELSFPVTSPQRFLMHRFHRPGVELSIRWFALMDYLETASSSAGRTTS